jgi:hypothetical protein
MTTTTKLKLAAVGFWLLLLVFYRELGVILSPVFIGLSIWRINRWIVERRERKVYYNAMRHFFFIGVPGGPDEFDLRIDRFARIEGREVFYVDIEDLGDEIEDLREKLDYYENDKGVEVYGYAMGYGANRGETDQEFLKRVEASIVKLMQAHEANLLSGQGRTMATEESKEQRAAWYVQYGAGSRRYSTQIEPDA